jgi:hypothetical protein
VDAQAKKVFRVAREELSEGQQDSPIPSEEAEQHPGDWAEGRRNQ